MRQCGNASVFSMVRFPASHRGARIFRGAAQPPAVGLPRALRIPMRLWQLAFVTIAVGALLLFRATLPVSSTAVGGFLSGGRDYDRAVAAAAARGSRPGCRRQACPRSYEPCEVDWDCDVPAGSAQLLAQPARGASYGSDSAAAARDYGGAAAPGLAAGGGNSSALAGASGPSRADGVFIAMGVVSNCMWGNSFERRRWIRET